MTKKSARLPVVMGLAMGVVALAVRPSWSQYGAQGSRPAQGQEDQAAGPEMSLPNVCCLGLGWVSPQQLEDVQAIRNERDWDKQMVMANDFATKYPGSPFLFDVYVYGVYAAQQRGGVAKAHEFAETILKKAHEACLRVRSVPNPNDEDRLGKLRRELMLRQHSTLLIE
jgi:hypothetical protein